MKILMISNHLGVQSGVQRYVQNLLLNLDLTRYQGGSVCRPLPAGSSFVRAGTGSSRGAYHCGAGQ